MPSTTIERLNGPQALARLQAGEGTLIDVREASETAQGHAQGARLLPLSELPQWAPGLVAEGRPILALCRSGARSLKACEALLDLGAQVANVEGGTLAWQSAGLPMLTPH